MTKMNNGKTSKNYYIWLDLPVDKPERDVSRLLKRLDEKVRCWKSDNGPDKIFYMSRVTKVSDVQNALNRSLSSIIRQAQDEVTKEFEIIVKLLENSKGYITPEELKKQVLPRVSPQWSLETVQSELAARHIPVIALERDFSIPQKPSDYVQFADHTVIEQIKGQLAQWRVCGGTDSECENLYTFLGVASNENLTVLQNKAQEQYKKGLSEQGNRRTVRQALAGPAKNIFKDKESRLGYDIALKLDAVGFWNNMTIRLSAQSEQGTPLMGQNDYFRTVAELVGIGLPVDHAKWLVYDYVVNKKKGQIGSSMSEEDRKFLEDSKTEEGRRRAIEAKNKALAEELKLKEIQAKQEEEKRQREAEIARQEEKAFIDLKSPIVSAKAVSAGISLSWQPVIGADGYYIIRQTGRTPINDTDTDGITKRLKAGDGECWTDNNNLMFGRNYYYIVYPCRGERHGKNGIAILKGTPTAPILWMQAVTGLRGSGRDDQITLRWTLPKISSPYSVRLIRRHDGREESIKLNETEYSGPYDDSNVTKGGTYSYRVVVNVGGKDVPSEETSLIVAKTPAITGDVKNREFVRRGRSVYVTWSWVPGVDKVVVSHTDKPQGTELSLSSLVEGRDFDICRRSDNSRGIEVMLKWAQTFIGVYPYNEVEARSAESDRLFLVEQRRIVVTSKKSWLGRCEALVFGGLQKGAHGGWLPEFVINARDVKNYTVEELGRSSDIDANGLLKVPDQYRKGYEFTFECKSKTDNSNYSFEKR